MTKVMCVYCSKEFLAFADATMAECEHCKHMQKVPKAAAGRARRLAISGTKLDQGSRIGVSSSLDGIIRSKLDQSKTAMVTVKIEDRNMMKAPATTKKKK